MLRLRLTMLFFFFSENQHALADRFPYVSIFVILFSACQLKIRLLNYVIHNLISCGCIEAGAGHDFFFAWKKMSFLDSVQNVFFTVKSDPWLIATSRYVLYLPLQSLSF